jgi:MtaA/CmuA family methyltransferase
MWGGDCRSPTVNTSANNSRADVLALLNGQRGSRRPVFSGLISVTQAGLDTLGLHFHETHTNPARMAAAAATTYRLFGFESAVVPLDMCVEAGALGAEVDFRSDALMPMFPAVAHPLADSALDLSLDMSKDITQLGRIPVVLEAIRRLKADVGQEVVVGAWIPGPFTLLSQLVDFADLMREVSAAPAELGRVLDALTDQLAPVAQAYRGAGADFITIHEMGGSPGVLGPKAFRSLVLPRLQRLIASIPAPRVLSACGRADRYLALLAECGAEAVSVDQQSDLAKAREALGASGLLFGNLDPIDTLANGDETSVRSAVRGAISASADAVWPGCDMWPPVPVANMNAMVDEARRWGA